MKYQRYITMDMTVVSGLHKFNLQATIDHQGPSMYSGRYTTPMNCCKMTICWMMWYCYSSLFGFKCLFQLYSSGFSISYVYRCHVTFCVGQLHPVTIYRAVFFYVRCLGVGCHCMLLLLFLDRVLFHHDICDYYRLSVIKLFWFCKYATPWMFSPLDILFEYWIEDVTFRLIYVLFHILY